MYETIHLTKTESAMFFKTLQDISKMSDTVSIIDGKMELPFIGGGILIKTTTNLLTEFSCLNLKQHLKTLKPFINNDCYIENHDDFYLFKLGILEYPIAKRESVTGDVIMTNVINNSEIISEIIISEDKFNQIVNLMKTLKNQIEQVYIELDDNWNMNKVSVKQIDNELLTDLWIDEDKNPNYSYRLEAFSFFDNKITPNDLNAVNKIKILKHEEDLGELDIVRLLIETNDNKKIFQDFACIHSDSQDAMYGGSLI